MRIAAKMLLFCFFLVLFNFINAVTIFQAFATTQTSLYPVSTSQYHTVGIQIDNTVVGTGYNNRGQLDVGTWTDIIQVAAGREHTVGLISDGTVMAVGQNNEGQANVSGWSEIIQVAAGENHSLGLKSDGTVVAVGRNNRGELDVYTWTDIIQISIYKDHTVGLKSDGTVVGTGNTSNNKLDVGTWANIIQVAAGRDHTVGLKSDGTVVAVGNDGEGRLNVSGWSDIIQVAAGEQHTVGLKSDGTVVAVGRNNNGQTDVYTWTDVAFIAARFNQTIGIKTDGSVVSVGDNSNNQLSGLTAWQLKVPSSIPPINAENDTYTTLEDTPVTTGNVLINDTLGKEPTTITAFDAISVDGNTVSYNGDGTFYYTPAANYTSSDSFTYTITDDDATTSTATVTINVDPIYPTPAAVNDTYGTLEDIPVTTGNVLSNDDFGDEPTTVTAYDVVSEHGGTVRYNGDGTFDYTPAPDFNEADSFTYTITDSDGATSTATVTINVDPVNDVPAAANDIYSTSEDIPVTTDNVLSNDDLGDEPTTITAYDLVSEHDGTVSYNGDGTFYYMPAHDFNEVDLFTYTITDSDSETSIATVTINVDPVNDVPVAVNDSYETVENTQLTTGNVLIDDDLGDEPSTITAYDATSAHGGTVSYNGDGTFNYTPAADYSGSDSFTYTITDTDGETSTATVTIDVAAVYDSSGREYPVSTSQYHTVGIQIDNTVVGTGYNNHGQLDVGTWTDIIQVAAGREHTVGLISDGTVMAVGQNNEGQANVSGWSEIIQVAAGENHSLGLKSDGTVVAVGKNNRGALDVFTWTDIIQVSTYNEHTVGVKSDGTVVGTGNTSNNKLDVGTWADIIQVAAGRDHTVGLKSDGTVVAVGNDGEGRLNVSGWSDIIQVAAGEQHTVGLKSDGTVVAVGRNDNGQTDVYTWNDVAFIAAGFNQTIGIKTDGSVVSVGDNSNNQLSGLTAWQLKVPSSIPPINAVDDSYETLEDTPVTTGNVLVNDELGNEPTTITAYDTTSLHDGTVSYNGDGTFIYSPAADFHNPDTFTYTITDNDGETSAATVTINVTPVNDTPAAIEDTYGTSEDIPVTTGNVLSNDKLGDEPSSITDYNAISVKGGIVTYNGDGTFYYIPAPDSNEVDSFTYTITDSDSETSTTTVTINVTPINDTPVAVNDSYETVEDTSVTTGNVLSNDDLGDEPTTITTFDAISVNGGTVSYNGDGTFYYTPAADYNGSDSFSYTITDIGVDTSTATVTINVVPIEVIITPSFTTPTNASDVTFTISGTDIIQYKYNLDDTGFSQPFDVSQPITLSSLSEGNHEIKVIGNNSTFSWQPESEANIFAWVADYTSPATSSSPQAGIYNSIQDVTLTSSEAGAMIYYTVDGSTPDPGVGTTQESITPLTITGLSTNTTIKYFSKDPAGNQEPVQEVNLIIDLIPPSVISNYPVSGTTVAPEQGQLTVRFVYGDDAAGTGIDTSAIQLLDTAGQDVTNLAQIETDDLSITLTDPADGNYTYTLYLYDLAGNQTVVPLSFIIDSNIPISSVSLPEGHYADPIFVDITVNKEATVYYSTDGYPPFEGAQNTTSVQAPAEGIFIDKITNLQFFAKDNAGNIEPTKSVTYYIGAIPGDYTELQVQYDTQQQAVVMTWQELPLTPINYHIYRCLNAIECEILSNSKNGGYPPPGVLRLASFSEGSSSYVDSTIQPGLTYTYGITVEAGQGIEGILSELHPIEIPEAGPTPDIETAKERALSWLQGNQDKTGFWGSSESNRILATSQVLNALKLSNIDNAGVRLGLFYLRGHHADNNDFLARQIDTLKAYGQNTNERITILLSQAYTTNALYGWGVESRYNLDALTTVLSIKALKGSDEGITLDTDRNYFDVLTGQTTLSFPVESDSPGSSRFSWAASNTASIYVSALVYHILYTHFPGDPYLPDNQWLVDAQAPDGSFGTGVVDTAAALLWIPLDASARVNAENYLVDQQTANGSWNNDPYITGLCLEALLSN